VLRKERLRVAFAVLVVGGLAALVAGRVATGSGHATAQPSPRPEAHAARPEAVSSPGRAAPPTPAQAVRETRAPGDQEARRARLAWTLGSYLEWAQYPPSSRPARERPDRLRLHASAPRRLPLVTARGERSEARVLLWQSHAYLAGEERAVLTVACEREGTPVACAVRSAAAMSDLPEVAVPAAPLAFADDGSGADRQAGDGVLSAAFAPAARGFAGFTGPVRVALEVDADGERGAATFALSYTAEAPARFTGAVRERLAAGSVEVCLGMRVQEAGRYLLDARVDDAAGETFAFVTFDGELSEGAGEACFEIFGKLVRDEEAQAPFTVRDVEGFRLLEDAFPDRHTVPAWEGRAHTTKAYAQEDFADRTWESEAKDRHVAGLRDHAEPWQPSPTQGY
jgi:hypothetical protein